MKIVLQDRFASLTHQEPRGQTSYGAGGFTILAADGKPRWHIRTTKAGELIVSTDGPEIIIDASKPAELNLWYP